MTDKPASVHWSFWVISVVALIYNAMGGINFLMQMNADMVASFPEAYQVHIENRPPWATAAFAVAVFGGVGGGILLLLRKSVAFYAFIASLLGTFVVMLYTLGIGAPDIDASPADFMVGLSLQVAVTVFLIWYAKYAARKGWVS